MNKNTFKLEDATINDLQKALTEGVITSVELTVLYLNRIYYYDHNGLKLNSIPLLNTEVLAQAAEMDSLRQQGKILGPLHGIPFTVKDSYMVKGMTVANGSPAFAHLMAKEDSFVVASLKAAGGILIGKTNMPPMAAGGMQRGVYGRAESPYNADFLPAAWFSGSSNGSGVSTAANFAAFGMAEETVSSGRSPASNNGLVAYTPSWGILSIRGNWPLFPIRDVVVPHTRTIDDLLVILDVIMRDDPEVSCDFWREQQVVKLPNSNDFRPDNFDTLKQNDSLQGKRIGVPKMYIGKDSHKEQPIQIRPSIKKLWQQTAKDLEARGAEVIEIDVPLLELYRQDPVYLKPLVEQGLLPEGWMETEWDYLAPYAIEAFLKHVNDENYPSFTDIDPSTIFPNPVGSVDELRNHNNARYDENIAVLKKGVKAVSEVPGFSEALKGLVNTRKQLFEQWLLDNNLDMLAFPANSEIGQSNADTNETAYDHAWQDGNFFSNTNYVIRHLGIPSVSVCMGTMEDTRMPVDITFIGPAYSDKELISYAYDYEQATQHHQPAPRTPALANETISDDLIPNAESTQLTTTNAQLTIEPAEFNGVYFELNGECQEDYLLQLFINGIEISPQRNGLQWQATVELAKLYQAGHYKPSHFNIITLAKNSGNVFTKALKVAVPQP